MSMKLKSRIMHKGTRGHEITERQQRINVAISKTRYKVERTFGSMHRWFGAGIARYVGLSKTHGAAYYGIHCLQLLPNTRDYCVKFYQII